MKGVHHDQLGHMNADQVKAPHLVSPKREAAQLNTSSFLRFEKSFSSVPKVATYTITHGMKEELWMLEVLHRTSSIAMLGAAVVAQ